MTRFILQPLFYKERNAKYYMRFLSIECIFTNKEQSAKANYSVLQGGARRKSSVIYIIDEILSFIHERLYFTN
ncbi:hypothetical protein DZB85_18575 [Bacillus sp. LB(2018)]|nr:hypothetical protein DZB85_18575 [Bacillus sp. LB(2018)]RFB68201.1 hypothetical protein DZB94_28975 [Bacillus sp. AW]